MYIRLLLEYGTYPVWLYADDGGVIDTRLPDELSNDTELEARFDDLQRRYHALFINNEKEFSYVGFKINDEKKAFYADMLDAIRELKEKLGGRYEIVDDISRKCK